MIELATVAIASSSAKVLSELVRRWVDGRTGVSPSEAVAKDSRETQALLELLLATHGTPAGQLAGAPAVDDLVKRIEESASAPEAALALTPDRVFQDARARLNLVFRINLAVSVAISVILLGALAATIVLAIQGKATLAIVFGGLTLTDIVFAAAYAPLDRVNKAIISTQRLDIIHLSTRERLQQAASLEPSARLRETKRIWRDIKDDLAALDSEGDGAAKRRH